MTDQPRPDILDYLYEELPPDRMDAERDAIAADQDSMDELRRVKEVVLAYRELPRPKPSAGLAARAAQMAKAAAPAEADSPEAPVEPAAVDEPAAVPGDAVAADGSRRRWFLHPGWMVAASVFIVFTVLLHISPRSGGKQHLLPTAAPRKTVPAAEPGAGEAAAPPRAELPSLPALPPKLPDAEPVESSTVRQSLPYSSSFSIAKSLVEGTPVESPAPSSALPDAAPTLDSESVPAAPAPPPPDAPSPTTTAAGAMPRREQIPDPSKDDIPVDVIDKLYDAMADQPDSPLEILGVDQAVPLVTAERPTLERSDDTVERLTFLIGLHLGEKEFAEAAEAIELLRRYDPAKAADLLSTLVAMEEAEAAAQALPPAAAASPAQQDAEAPASVPHNTGIDAEPSVSAPDAPAAERNIDQEPDTGSLDETVPEPNTGAPQASAPEPAPEPPTPAASAESVRDEPVRDTSANAPAEAATAPVPDSPPMMTTLPPDAPRAVISDPFVVRPGDAASEPEPAATIPVPGSLGPSTPWPPPYVPAPSQPVQSQTTGRTMSPSSLFNATQNGAARGGHFTTDPYRRGD